MLNESKKWQKKDREIDLTKGNVYDWLNWYPLGSGADRRNHTGLRGGYDERRDSNFL